MILVVALINQGFIEYVSIMLSIKSSFTFNKSKGDFIMKRSKIAALILAATMLTGTAAAGSYAYFSSKAEITAPSSLMIKTGKMNLEVSQESDWMTFDSAIWDHNTIESIASKLPDGTTSFEKVKPGEEFVKFYEITPKDSNLTQKVTFTGGDIIPETPDFTINCTIVHFTPTTTNVVNKGDVITLTPEDRIFVQVYVGVSSSISGENLGGEQDKVFNLTDNITPIEFHGAQINQ